MWIEKWKLNRILNDSWRRFIIPSNNTSRKMYGLVKSHKEGSPVRLITSGNRKLINFWCVCAYIPKF